jgi:WD40 repeat protein
MVLVQQQQQTAIATAVDFESVSINQLLPTPPVTEKWISVHTLSNTSRNNSSASSNSTYGDTVPTVLLASASRDRLVNVFDATDNTTAAAQTEYSILHSNEQQQYPLLQTLDSHTSSVTAVKFSKVNSSRNFATLLSAL